MLCLGYLELVCVCVCVCECFMEPQIFAIKNVLSYKNVNINE
jgi:hypothetical protein